MIKEKGVKAGREFKVFKVWKGTTNNRDWCFFLYSQSEKQADGSYVSGMKYTLWVENDEIISKIQAPCSLYLTEILLVKPTTDQYGKLGIEIRAKFSLNPPASNKQGNTNTNNNTDATTKPGTSKNDASEFGFASSIDDFNFGL